MSRIMLILLAALAGGAPAAAQTTMSSMPGMAMPMDGPAAPPKATQPGKAPHPKPAPNASTPPVSTDDGSMAGMSMDEPVRTGSGRPDPMPMPMPMPMPKKDAAETEIPKLSPPPAPQDYAADRFYDPVAMDAARAQLRREHGGSTLTMVSVNLAEYQSQPSGGGYRWDGEGWVGGDIDRFVFKSEGEGGRRDGLGAAEIQGLYSRAISPYFDLQAGVRQDFAPLGRTYATVGFEGLAPYRFNVSGAVFVSSQGEVLGRLEGVYDLHLTQRLILQPRAELNFAAQNTYATKKGSGLSNAELGLRLRYEIRRQIAPYIGVSWDRKMGRTADYARMKGDDVGGAVLVAGVRTWF